MHGFDAPFWSAGGGSTLRVVLTAPIAYAGLVALLRVSGKRSVAKLSAFDLVVTVALGSMLASIVLSPETALAEGVAGIGVLVTLQWVVASVTARSRVAGSIVKARPRIVARDGKVVEGALKRENLGPDEVLAALRKRGQRSLRDVLAVVLESDGTLSVIPDGDGECEALRGVRGWDDDRCHRVPRDSTPSTDNGSDESTPSAARSRPLTE